MTYLVVVLGLLLLIFLHELGHFTAARAVGIKPRKFYVGFPPALVKMKRNGVEYGIGSIPLGGYVKIPGMNRPSPGDLAATLKPADQERYRGELVEADGVARRLAEEGLKVA